MLFVQKLIQLNKERVCEGEYSGNIMYLCMENETCWNCSTNGDGGIKDKYDIL
jgi:hypothetical protein